MTKIPLYPEAPATAQILFDIRYRAHGLAYALEGIASEFPPDHFDPPLTEEAVLKQHFDMLPPKGRIHAFGTLMTALAPLRPELIAPLVAHVEKAEEPGLPAAGEAGRAEVERIQALVEHPVFLPLVSAPVFAAALAWTKTGENDVDGSLKAWLVLGGAHDARLRPYIEPKDVPKALASPTFDLDYFTAAYPGLLADRRLRPEALKMLRDEMTHSLAAVGEKMGSVLFELVPEKKITAAITETLKNGYAEDVLKMTDLVFAHQPRAKIDRFCKSVLDNGTGRIRLHIEPLDGIEVKGAPIPYFALAFSINQINLTIPGYCANLGLIEEHVLSRAAWHTLRNLPIEIAEGVVQTVKKVGSLPPGRRIQEFAALHHPAIRRPFMRLISIHKSEKRVAAKKAIQTAACG